MDLCRLWYGVPILCVCGGQPQSLGAAVCPFCFELHRTFRRRAPEWSGRKALEGFCKPAVLRSLRYLCISCVRCTVACVPALDSRVSVTRGGLDGYQGEKVGIQARHCTKEETAMSGAHLWQE